MTTLPATLDCPHGEQYGPGFVCPPCQRATAPLVAAPEPEWSFPFPAQFDGVCAGCEFPINPGDVIRMVVNGDSKRAVHNSDECMKEAA